VKKKKTFYNNDRRNSKLFSDVSVLCGVDGGVIKTSRLFLSGLSRFLYKVFHDHNFNIKEETVVVLPDVNSRLLAELIDNVCSGHNSQAKIDPSLEFLGFGLNPDSGYVSGISQNDKIFYPGVESYCLQSIADGGGSFEDDSNFFAGNLPQPGATSLKLSLFVTDGEAK
jgi:hypothetical protein